MNKALAQDILKVIDSPFAVQTIVAYADVEIERANTGLQMVTDPIELYKLQGIVQAMRTLKSIRDVAANVVR